MIFHAMKIILFSYLNENVYDKVNEESAHGYEKEVVACI